MLDTSVETRRATSQVSILTDGMAPETVWTRTETELGAGRSVWLGGRLADLLGQRFGVQRDGRLWVEIPPPPMAPSSLYRVRDMCGAGVALLLLAPLFAIGAVLVKLSSPGPVFYAANVLGKGRRSFVWHKFRSMHVKPRAEDESARREQFRAYAQGDKQGKVIDETRVTRIGAFLRKYSLDELPQLWNVLKGDMTLVGPRPCLPYEAETFPAWAERRFQVCPGLTGVWQVAGRARVPLVEGLTMDVYYCYARSLRLDAKLIWETIQIIWSGEGGK